MDTTGQSQAMKETTRRVTKQSEARGIKVKRKPMFDEGGKVLLNGVQLTFQKGFGFSQEPEMKSNAYCIDDNRIIYILTKQIIIYDMLAETQKVVDYIGQEEEITSFLYFKNIMLDDNAIYAVQAINKTFPSIILNNFSKGNHTKYVLAHLEKQEKVVEISLLNENRHFCLLSELQGTYRFSIIQIQSKELFASESIYFEPKGLIVPQHYQRTVFLYSHNEIYMILLDNQVKLIPLNLRKHITDHEESITQIVCSVGSDITLYAITNKGYLHLMKINLVTNAISKLDSVFLGEYETLPGNQRNEMAQIRKGDKKQEEEEKEGQKDKEQQKQKERQKQKQKEKSSSVKKVRANRVPSSICCNEYNIVIGYYHVEEFTLVKISSVGREMSPYQKQMREFDSIDNDSMKAHSILQHIRFSCPYLHKIAKMNFAHETMAICVLVQVKENDKYGLTVPIESQFLKEKGEQKIIKQNVYNHSLPQGKVFPIVFNLLLHDTLVETLRSPVQSILSSTLLVKQILDISILPTKKLFLILSAERKIKAIKYEHVGSTSFERMLAWQTTFNPTDNPSSLDTHPLTFNVAVGLKEGIKIFNICSQGLKTSNIQFPMKNCESVRYSKYGHVLVAGSSNQIIIINPYEHKIINTIQLGHGYMVKELSFIDRDMYLMGSFSNGSNMILNIENGNKMFEVNSKNEKAISSAYDHTFDIMIVSYTGNSTKFYRDHGRQELAPMWTFPFNITKILVCNELGTIFMGTSLGKIRCHQWPFTDGLKFSKSFTEIQLHNKAITQMKVTHDLSMLVSGSEDGSVFITKINAHSDGIVVNDSEMMHTFRTVNKNYMSLYYLQKYQCTNSNIESEQEECIVQLESDKADFQTEHMEIIGSLREEIDRKVTNEELRVRELIRNQMLPQEQMIDQLNDKKNRIKDELASIYKSKEEISKEMESQKLNKMRELYHESDQLKEKLAHYIEQYTEESDKAKALYKGIEDKVMEEYDFKIQQLQGLCNEQEAQGKQAKISYTELMKEQDQEGKLYMETQLQQMANQLKFARERGEELRKIQNKTNHENLKCEDKLKYFQQMITEMNIDITSCQTKNEQLQEQEKYLVKVLSMKDKQILEEERNVKELLTTNINNYSHEEYLKHRQDELLSKATFLEKEIDDLEGKYKVFQDNFIQATKQSNENSDKISVAIKKIKNLKNMEKRLGHESYQLVYQQSQMVGQIQKSFSKIGDKVLFVFELNRILKDIETKNKKEADAKPGTMVNSNGYKSGNTEKANLIVEADNTLGESKQFPLNLSIIGEHSVDENLCKRDHMIKQVMNTNKLRKIDDTIRRTIMVKLNRETQKLTCEVNQLRKEKRKMTGKVRELRALINDIRQIDGDSLAMKKRGSNEEKENISLQEIVPPNANISIIREDSLIKGNQKLLPFQLYHQNKVSHGLSALSSSHPKASYHQSKHKSEYDESSTQLPSIIKNSHNSHLQSSSGTSRLYGVDEENDDEILQ